MQPAPYCFLLEVTAATSQTTSSSTQPLRTTPIPIILAHINVEGWRGLGGGWRETAWAGAGWRGIRAATSASGSHTQQGDSPELIGCGVRACGVWRTP